MVDRRLLPVALLLVVSASAPAQVPPVPEGATGEPKPTPRLFVTERIHELGSVIEGDKATVRWLLENRGDADLIIERTRSSCGCTVVKLTEEQKLIPPGGSLELEAEFNTRGRRGTQTKTVTVYSNDPSEPTLKLEFKANITRLYEIKPAGLVNLRNVRRGQIAATAIEIFPGAGHKSVEILGIQIPDDSPLSLHAEPFDGETGKGQRIRATVDEYVALGTLKAKATLRLSIDGIERERDVAFRGEVVGDLTWRPKTVDATRQVSIPGKQFAPITIRSVDNRPFDVLEASAGSLFDVTLKPTGKTTRRTQYLVVLTLREDAREGPFGAMLQVRTSSLDQPIVRVPVFGIVAAPIDVDPPMVLLRQDGTDVGTHRRVKLQVPPQRKLEISEIVCDNEAIVAVVDREASSRYRHIRYLDVKLARELPVGTHSAVLTVTTGVDGTERLTIPISVEVPSPSG